MLCFCDIISPSVQKYLISLIFSLKVTTYTFLLLILEDLLGLVDKPDRCKSLNEHENELDIPEDVAWY